MSTTVRGKVHPGLTVKKPGGGGPNAAARAGLGRYLGCGMGRRWLWGTTARNTSGLGDPGGGDWPEKMPTRGEPGVTAYAEYPSKGAPPKSVS